MKTTKAIEWSYPTSTNAEKLGFADTGCYSVELRHGKAQSDAIIGFTNIAAAELYAERLPFEWDRFTRRQATETGKD